MTTLTRISRRQPVQQYIVWRRSKRDAFSVSEQLVRYPGVRILEDDPGEALVEMSETVRKRIAREHPELAIEPNVIYELL